MKKLLYTFLFSAVILAPAFSQDEPLPRGFSPEELLWLSENKPVPGAAAFGITEPPSLPVRAMAEWEEMQAMVVTWRSYKPILAQIVQAAKEEVRVVIVNSNLAACQSELTNFGVDWQSGNVEFLQAPSNSVWIRDYGANPIYLNGVDSLALVDWIYNRPRPLDDIIPDAVGNYFGLPVYSTTVAPYDLTHPGGNNFSDGMGTNFSSKLILDENGPLNQWGTSNHTEEGVDSIMERFYGIDRYVKFTNLPYDGIHHIDMHMKLLNETTLLVGEYPEGVPDRAQIEANIQYLLDNFTTPFGTPYRVVRIPMPPENGKYPSMGAPLRTYVNSFIVNKTVLLPTYELQYDTTALRIWQEAMPGYNIVGINCNGIIDAGGAIHCIVKEVGVQDPLLIQHNPLDDIVGANPPGYEVNAWIRHRSGIAGATLYYTTDTAAAYQSLDMALAQPDSNRWSASIPQQPEGSTVYYYIHANANSGKQVVRPLVAPEGYFDFYIYPATAAEEVPTSSLGKVFPNPASALTCIPVEATVGGETVIEISDLLGRKVGTVFSGTLPAGVSRHYFRADGLAAGVYQVVLRSEGGVQAQKIIVK
ncbi:MAG: agmatine deiminase family protein [Saprospiraceae bacterium]|nr:agmatine deiminase family protein [Saprospiraceae bacterium]